MVLVVGATGLVGHEVCRKLVERGERVRALVRATSSKEKIESLKSSGVDLYFGDLKDAQSIAGAVEGVEAVISTASSTLSRQQGDSIQSVDEAGQLNLVSAAKHAKVERFILVSFRRTPQLSFPLSEAKAKVEDAIGTLNFTIIQASWFMEVWLSPALGFDYPNASARIYGPGTSPISWVSYRDVAGICAMALRHPAASRQTIQFGGPEALTPLDVVSRFEALSGRRFTVEHVPGAALQSQFEEATDPMQKTFAALMLGYLHGDAMDMRAVVDTFGIELTNVTQYARSVLGRSAVAG
jgi:uncharacterized protein YbjT (DUF2867 family)